MSEERRRSPRYAVDVPARLTAQGKAVAARVRDICRDAVLVEADTWFPLGTEVAVEAELPKAEGAIQVAGRVIRLAPGERAAHGMAVLFGDLPSAAATQIDLFIAAQEKS
jgi:Tfp pilus assembly protein PilZ